MVQLFRNNFIFTQEETCRLQYVVENEILNQHGVLGVEDGIKVSIEAKADDYCELHVTVNGATAQIVVAQDEFKLYDVYFRKCDKSNIKITAYGDCLIDKIDVCKEEIIDKGKARLCLPPEVTENLPSGPLSVNGAIMVDGKTYGLATTQIGTINKLPRITLNL